MQNIDETKRALTYLDNDADLMFWRKIGAALKTEYGDDVGFQLWNDWSMDSPRYNQSEAKAQWRNIKEGKVNIGTLFYYAQKEGFTYDKTKYVKPDPKQLEERKREIEERNKQIEEQRKELAEKAKIISLKRWSDGKPLSMSNQYLKNKGLSSASFLTNYLKEDSKNNLLIPIKNNNELVGTQRITYTGAKFLEKDMNLVGASLFMGNWDIAKKNGVILAEGLATGASLLDAKNDIGIVICFHGYNMIQMAKKIKENTDVKVYIASDIDKKGREFADKAKAVLGDRGVILEPSFTEDDINLFKKEKNSIPNDFNDLYQIKGKEFVKNQIEQQMKNEIKKNFKTGLENFKKNNNVKQLKQSQGIKI